EIDWSYAVIERMDAATLKTTLIPFDLGKLVLQHDSSQDMELQPGDLVSVFSQADIHVPIAEQTTLVRLEGEFVHAGTYSVRPGARLESYLQLAGGPNPEADRRHMFLIRANGAVISRESVKGPWGTEFYHLKLFPGDTIIVPDKSVKPSALRGFLGLSQVFSQ